MSVPREPRVFPLPDETISTKSGWAKYLGLDRVTYDKYKKENRIKVQRKRIIIQPAPIGAPVGSRGKKKGRDQ